jgi:hypothetical protein
MCDTAGRPNHDKDWQELVTTLASLYDSNAMKITYKKKHTVYLFEKNAWMCVAAKCG